MSDALPMGELERLEELAATEADRAVDDAGDYNGPGASA